MSFIPEVRFPGESTHCGVQVGQCFQRLIARSPKFQPFVVLQWSGAAETARNELQRFLDDGQMEGGREGAAVKTGVFGTDKPNTIHIRKIYDF